MSWKEVKVTFKPRKCPHCGGVYTPRTATQRFCGEKCRDLYWQAKRAKEREKSLQPRKCDFCGKEFVPKSGNQIYCSKRCGIKKARDEGRRLDKKPAEKEKKVVNKTENMREIARIDRSAREKGLSYGRYIARYGAI